MDNLVLLTDSYKVSHYRQYPPGTEYIHSYLESRGAQEPIGGTTHTVFFGLQYILDRYLAQPVLLEHVDEASEIYSQHFGSRLFNRIGWLQLLAKHDGRLPVSIKAVPEGTLVPLHNALMTVENTDPEFPWLTNWLETLLVQVWYGTTVATLSRQMKLLILDSLERTGDPELINFKLHDFGFRGVSSVESAGIGGCAHLVNFMGTDTVPALVLARDYYGHPCAGFSIPAAEHSTIISWAKEEDAYRNMIQQFGGGSLYAVVSDSYDIYAACRDLWGGTLLQEVEGAAGTLVVRPDSGVPHHVVPDVISTLMGKFGYQTNAKGFNVLNPKVRVIQGDGIDYAETGKILSHMEIVDQSADNIAFGMGGALLQKLNRDTLKFAFKASHIAGHDEATSWERDISKNPVTDTGKASKAGRLRLIKDDQLGYRTVRQNDWIPGSDELLEVFRDGKILRTSTLAEIRARAS